MQNQAGFGGRWVIVVASGRSVRSDRCASCGCADAKFRGESQITLDEEEIADVNLATFMFSTRKTLDHQGTAWLHASGTELGGGHKNGRYSSGKS